ncbi:mobilization protein [Candidatus Igneacidithiobacillus taiwanensis]|uniref:mobilization protein n=1 Tax=Candidatus Igneacidithiobacillus taiwanensis TaxID=1945924 RepID=UPI00289C8D39|nr:mobilization protein [Candidatus Igneacidithiobacillus taiwanensis]
MKIDERIESLQAKLDQAIAKKKQIEARKRAAEAKRNRKNDTRRKILAGAIVLDMIEKGLANKDVFMSAIDSRLKRDDDRALFGLPPLPKPEPEPEPVHDTLEADGEVVGYL